MAIIPGILASSQQAGTGAFWNLATVTGNGSASTLTFSSIPSGYKSLHIRGIAKDTTSLTTPINLSLRFNGDSASNYAASQFYSNTNGSVYSGTQSSSTVITLQAADAPGSYGAANAYGSSIVDIIDYSSTTKYKTIKSISGITQNSSVLSSGTIVLNGGVCQSTAAITSIAIIEGAGNFTTNTTYTLYGVK